MKSMQNTKRIFCRLLPMLFLIFSACEKDETVDPGPDPDLPKPVDPITLKVNVFVTSLMYDAYLWDNKLPSSSSFDIRYENDPKKLLDKLVYEELDHWTYLSDNADQSQGELEGDGKTFGYSIAMGQFSNGTLFGIIEFVYPESPAEKAGLKRGDILIEINDKDITLENYMQFYYEDKIKLTLGKLTDDNYIKPLDKQVNMQSIEMILNPLVAQRVIEVDGHKVGYLCYSDYQINSHEKLEKCLQEFKDAGITDMVLDLRYNLGGHAVTSTYLSSMLAPAAKVEAEELLLKEIWNDNYMKYYAENGEEEKLKTHFDPEVPVNLDLPKLYVLTSGNTASASESTIIGLQPHMEVVQIGTRTSGKYCGALALQPQDKNIDNWMLMIVVYKFANKEGFTDFKDGIDPQHEVKEDLLANVVPLGNEADPLLSKALSLITSKEATATTTKSSTHSLQYRLLPELNPKWNRNGMITFAK